MVYTVFIAITVDIKSLHTSVKMPGFCDNETKINHFWTFSTFNVNYNLYMSIKNKLKYFREGRSKNKKT